MTSDASEPPDVPRENAQTEWDVDSLIGELLEAEKTPPLSPVAHTDDGTIIVAPIDPFLAPVPSKLPEVRLGPIVFSTSQPAISPDKRKPHLGWAELSDQASEKRKSAGKRLRRHRVKEEPVRLIDAIKTLPRSLFGPHFHVDVVRLTRKGWTTAFRVLYLSLLLLGMLLFYSSASPRSLIRLSDFADYARGFAWMLVTLQDIAIIALMPIYLSTAISEERESGTLESMFLTHLTDRDIVLGKYLGRLSHIAILVLATTPLLTFLYLWGNVEIEFFIFRQTLTLAMIVAAGAVCTYISSTSDTNFNAIKNSYLIIGPAGLVGELMLFGAGRQMSLQGVTLPAASVLLLAAAAAFFIAYVSLYEASTTVGRLRLEENKMPKASASAIMLTDGDAPYDDTKLPRRRRRPRFEEDDDGSLLPVEDLGVSKIHPLALPIPDDALYWKECIKDGSRFSLRFRWFFLAIPWVAGAGLLTTPRFLVVTNQHDSRAVSIMLGGIGYCYYIIPLVITMLAVAFQTTASVAGEKELGTLDFLLLIPDERRRILWMKILGPYARNWPLFAVAFLGALFSLASSAISPFTFLNLMLVPLPFFLMLSGIAIWLSVACRRPLHANFALVIISLGLIVAHAAAFNLLPGLLAYYATLLTGSAFSEFTRASLAQGIMSVIIDQAAFSAIGLLGLWRAFRRFLRDG